MVVGILPSTVCPQDVSTSDCNLGNLMLLPFGMESAHSGSFLGCPQDVSTSGCSFEPGSLDSEVPCVHKSLANLGKYLAERALQPD